MPFDEQFVENSGPSAYVGLIPAAGIGSRLPNRKLSKEILPVRDESGRDRPVIAHLLVSMATAGVTEVTAVVREEKTDVNEYLNGENWNQIQFNNVSTNGTSGVPETVAIGLEQIGQQKVLFGFPDILFEPRTAFRDMIEELENGSADVVLGLFPTESPSKMDMVNVDKDGRVLEIDIKPTTTEFELTWILAAWQPSFSRYLKSYLQSDEESEHLGHVFQGAIAAGLVIGSRSFSDGRSLDIGTPDDLIRADSWAN